MKCIFLVVGVLCLNAVTANGIHTKKVPPKWSQVHTVNGILYISETEIEEPIDAWYDENKNKARIDYYDGTVKTYQLGGSSKVKCNPITTDTVLNQMRCSQKFKLYVIQSILPDCSDYKWERTEFLFGWECDKFVYESTYKGSNKTKKQMMWVRYEKQMENLLAIPVRYESRDFLGSEHINFNSYETPDEIPKEIFDVHVDIVDEGLLSDEPDSHSFDEFNPIRAFIDPVDLSHIEKQHTQFKNEHGIVYATAEEHEYRQQIFARNLHFINSMNRKHLGYSLAVNFLADKTPDEMNALSGHKSSLDNSDIPSSPDVDENIPFPDTLDWRLYGAVTPVKNQAGCGSCWAFATVGAIEGEFFVHNKGNLVRLSEQALIDCSWGEGNNGCEEGDPGSAFSWIKNKGGIPTDESYGGYKEKEGFCHANNTDVETVAPIDIVYKIIGENITEMKSNLYTYGPILVRIDARQDSFTFFSHGVYYEPKCKKLDGELDHFVLVVGYGTMNGEEYWLVKNSWGPRWGNAGYILMSVKDNNCGVLTEPLLVTFEKEKQ